MFPQNGGDGNGKSHYVAEGRGIARLAQPFPAGANGYCLHLADCLRISSKDDEEKTKTNPMHEGIMTIIIARSI
jgi:hypothetical protein